MGLLENSPRQSFKCLVAVAIERASTSQGSHVVCDPLSFVLNKLPRCKVPLHITCTVALIAGFLTASSVTIYNWSASLGKVIVRACCAW